MKAWDDLERKKRAKSAIDDFTPGGKSDIGDPAIVDLRRKIIAAIGESAPFVRTAEIDTLLAEFADGLIDRERERWQKAYGKKLRNARYF